MADPAVVVHGPEDVADDLRERTGVRVASASQAADLADASAVVGVAAEPWPSHAEAHERVRDAVAPAPYFAVQAWHLHPAYLAALTELVRRAVTAVGAEAHVLFTAPGPGREPEPHEVVFLREVAEAISTELGLTRRSIAWVGGETTPTTQTALTALVEAHERTTVLRCSLDPLGRPDGVHAEASQLGVELHEVRLRPADVGALLAAVVDTVLRHEGLGEVGS